MGCPELSFEAFDIRRPRAPLLCMSVCLSVTPAVSGVHGADEQQKTKYGPKVATDTSTVQVKKVLAS